MNERIKQLLTEATSGHEQEHDRSKVMTVSDAEMERFAFLIIRECMRQVEEQYTPVLEDEVMMKDTHWDGYVHCGVDSYVAIREHFYGEQE